MTNALDRVHGNPVLDYKIAKVDKEYVAILYGDSKDFSKFDDSLDELQDDYEADHLIWINIKKGVKIVTANSTVGKMPETDEPDFIVEKDALAFLSAILDHEKDVEYRHKLADEYDFALKKIRELSPCPNCEGTGDEIVGYTLDDRHPFVDYCSECGGTGTTENLKGAATALKRKIFNLKIGKETE